MDDMPFARHGLVTSVLDERIYVIGGYKPGAAGFRGRTTVDVFDPATNTWTAAPDMPTGRYGPRASVVDGMIYVLGGGPYWPMSAALGTVEAYDP